MADDGYHQRRYSGAFDPLARLAGELSRTSQSTPSSPRPHSRRARGEPPPCPPLGAFDVLERAAGPGGASDGAPPGAGGGPAVNWRERCLELQLELHRSRTQATRTRDMLREKESTMTNITPYLVAAVLGIILATLLYFKKAYNYWTSKGVYHGTPVIPFGTAKDFFLTRISMGELVRDLYFDFKSKGLKFGGGYMALTPQLIVTDLDLIKRIIQTDYTYFASHGMHVDEEVDPLSGHLFNLDGPKWKSMRTKLTPTFTSGKMKMMFETFVACTEGLEDLLAEQTKSGEPIEIKETLARFTTDIIGSCAFGLDCNSMKDPDAEFRKYGKEIFVRDNFTLVKAFLLRLLPKAVLHRLKIKLTKSNVEKFFMNAVKQTVDYREKNNLYRKDFMHLLLQLKNRGKVSDDDKITAEDGSASALTINELAAQCFVFFIAGYETSSTAMSFALYELAENQDVQDKLREEIDEVLGKHGGKLTYEAVKDMTYLERVLQETMRLHPPVTMLPRACTKTYTIPGTDVTIEPKTVVHVSVLGIHNDPEYYPDPQKFDPERFTEEISAKRPHFTYLPFGEGPRICIGLRFGLLQSKVGLITLIKNYKITLSEKTETPLKAAPGFIINEVQGGIWINAEKVE